MIPVADKNRGVIAWMVANPIVANLLMIVLILGGILMSTKIKKEVFPEFELDIVEVTVAYPGASPEEIERGIVTAVENGIRGLSGIEEITATAREGVASIRVELSSDADRQQTFQDIRQEVDRIRTFPENAENPQVNLASRKREVLQIVLYGEAAEAALRELAEVVRDRLLESDGISQVDVLAQRDFEIHVELNQEGLREYGLTHTDVATSIRNASVELPGGQIRTDSSDVLIRVSDRREYADDIRAIVVLRTVDGGLVRVGDVATVNEGFSEEEVYNHYNGKPSVALGIYRVGDQTPVGVADTVLARMEDIGADLPDGIEWTIGNDRSERYRDRLSLLLKNAAMGLVLVMGLLAVFLEVRLAFWVTMGIPASFLGALLILPIAGVSINIISMFAFIIALGIVVDDAIVAGENIYENRQRGMSFPEAAVEGAREVSAAIGFAICTNIITFLPLAFIPGTIGKIWKVIPFVVIATFVISWVESLLILPSHLAHKPRTTRIEQWMDHARVACSAGLAWFIRRLYTPILHLTLRWRAATVAVCLGAVLLTWAFATSGRMGWILMPRVESDMAAVTAVFPDGTPQLQVSAARNALVASAQAIADEHEDLVVGIEARTSGKTIEVFAHLHPPEIRPITTAEVTKRWRERTGNVEGARYVRFESDRGGPGSGAGVTLEISHSNSETLDRAAKSIAERLQAFPAVQNVDDGTARGVEQLNAKLSPVGESLGVTSTELARQIRGKFFGTEALRYQRDRHEVRVLVRRPLEGRDSRDDITSILIRTPAGTQVPLSEVATVTTGRAFTVINRRDAKRTLSLRANVSPIGETSKILDTLKADIMPSVQADFPGLSYSFQGRQRSFKESLGALLRGLLLSLVAMYFLLAVAFRSYLQPLVVMAALPLGAVGAVMGHYLLGFNLSILSLMGFIALSGVLVNDAIVLVTFANKLVGEGVPPHNAIAQAAVRRFRPVLLTTLTTFGGLAPMIFETSRQARFMIPMAISLGFGILLATAVTLILIPSLYSLVAEAKSRFSL